MEKDKLKLYINRPQSKIKLSLKTKIEIDDIDEITKIVLKYSDIKEESKNNANN